MNNSLKKLKNLQETYKIFKKNYSHLTEILKTQTYFQDKLNIIHIQCLNFDVIKILIFDKIYCNTTLAIIHTS